MYVSVSSGFSSAHFLIQGEKCERLHGHNYKVKVSVEGEPDRRGVIIDFLKLKSKLYKLCKRFDHKVILPMEAENLEIVEKSNTTHVRFHNKEYVFPSEDLSFLPIKSSSTEELAKYICEELSHDIMVVGNIKGLSVTVEELQGQGATYTIKK